MTFRQPFIYVSRPIIAGNTTIKLHRISSEQAYEAGRAGSMEIAKEKEIVTEMGIGSIGVYFGHSI